MARMTIDGADAASGGRKSVCGPYCGSGRMLLAAADILPGWEFVGQDVDLHCVRMTAINLALGNHYGYIAWGSGLANTKMTYQTGFNGRGFVRELSHEVAEAAMPAAIVDVERRGDRPQSQLNLF